jgi:Zn-dependent protease with chaperone function
MKTLGFLAIITNILIFPTIALASPVELNSSSQISQLNIEQESTEAQPESKSEEDSTPEETAESQTPPEEEPNNDNEESEEKAKEPTPEEIARLKKLAIADRLYLAGDKAAAVKLYREAKEVWDLERERAENHDNSVKTFSDPAELSPAGKVYWRNYQQGKEQQLETKTLSALKLLTTREPQFLAGHVHYSQTLLEYDRLEESQKVLDRAVGLYPNEPEILKAKMRSDIAAERWLDASVMARQFALFNPDSPQVGEFERLAEEYLAQYQSDLRSSITWNAIGNAIAGTVGFALTGNIFGPISALQTTSLLLNGESAVGEASVKQIKKQVPLIKDEEVTEYINEIGQKIEAASGREEFDYEFHIIMDDALNAFALPGGKIFVNAGAIMKTDSEAELAGLLAHEVAHSALSHGFQLATKGNLTANIVSYIPYVGNTASNLLVLNYSRDMEKQADIYGTKVLVNSGYAADGVRNLMAQLHEAHQDRDRSEPPSWLSSHPNTKQRIEYIERLIVDRGLNRHTYEGVTRHQEIKEIVTAQWKEYEECVEEVTTIKEAKKCAGEPDESENLEQSPTDLENTSSEKSEKGAAERESEPVVEEDRRQTE